MKTSNSADFRADEEAKLEQLLSLCQRITVDGRISEAEVQELVRWLRDNRNLPSQSVEQLLAAVSRIVADRRVTQGEARELLETLRDAAALAEHELHQRTRLSAATCLNTPVDAPVTDSANNNETPSKGLVDVFQLT